jgi:hypothetical protein
MKVKSLFNCTQQELYLTAPLAWAFCRRNLARFSKLKGFYTEGYVDDRIEEVKAAKAIPNHKIRKDEPSTHKILMDAAIEDCCYYFTLLKALILTAFKGDLLATKLDAAGASFFDKAESGNEGALGDLNDSALQFIQNNEAALKANNNMTDTFLSDYQAVVDDYNTHRANYTNSSTVATTTTVDNTNANNALYTSVMEMLSDGRAIFRKEPELRDQCTFSNFLDQVVETSVAGMRGKVSILGETKGIPNVKVTIGGRDKQVQTNKSGRYDMPQLAAGKYTIIFSCEGYKDVVVKEFEVKTGVYNTLNVAMEAVVEVLNAAA